MQVVLGLYSRIIICDKIIQGERTNTDVIVCNYTIIIHMCY